MDFDNNPLFRNDEDRLIGVAEQLGIAQTFVLAAIWHLRSKKDSSRLEARRHLRLARNDLEEMITVLSEIRNRIPKPEGD